MPPTRPSGRSSSRQKRCPGGRSKYPRLPYRATKKLHYHYAYNPQKMIANALFADGAAAVVAEGDGWRLTASGSCLVPDSADAMTWTVGDHGFEMTLARNVPALIGRHLRPFLEGWLGRNRPLPRSGRSLASRGARVAASPSMRRMTTFASARILFIHLFCQCLQPREHP